MTYQNTKNIIVLYEYKYIIRKIDKMLISENGGNFMALSKKPVTGMKDILPEEMQIRDYVQNVIKETYRSFGFTPIELSLIHI